MKLDVAERAAGSTARDYAYTVIRENLVSLNLAPGSILNDVEIAEALGISRTPVREAINQLKSESEIIEIYPQRGMKVALIDLGMIREVRHFRTVLEMEMIRICCRKAEETDLKWFEDSVAMQQFFLERKHPEQTMQLDNEFHKKLYDIAGCGHIHHFIRGMMIHYDRVRTLEMEDESYREAVEDHDHMVHAMRQKDEDRAAEIMRVHLERGIRYEERIRAKHPEYFKTDT